MTEVMDVFRVAHENDALLHTHIHLPDRIPDRDSYKGKCLGFLFVFKYFTISESQTVIFTADWFSVSA